MDSNGKILQLIKWMRGGGFCLVWTFRILLTKQGWTSFFSIKHFTNVWHLKPSCFSNWILNRTSKNFPSATSSSSYKTFFHYNYNYRVNWNVWNKSFLFAFSSLSFQKYIKVVVAPSRLCHSLKDSFSIVNFSELIDGICGWMLVII